jgi:hypothetical protein
LGEAATDHQGRGAWAGAPVRRAADADGAARPPQVLQRAPRRRLRGGAVGLRAGARGDAPDRAAGDGGVQVARVHGPAREAVQEERRVVPGHPHPRGAHRQVPGQLPRQQGKAERRPRRLGALRRVGGAHRRGVRQGHHGGQRRRARHGQAAPGRPRVLRRGRGQEVGPQDGHRAHRRDPRARGDGRRRAPVLITSTYRFACVINLAIWISFARIVHCTSRPGYDSRGGRGT